MPNDYFERNTPVAPGTTIRSDKYNTDMLAVETAFEKVHQDFSQRLVIPEGIQNNQLPAFPMKASFILIDDEGNWGYWQAETFLNDVANTKTFRDETESFKNSAYQSKVDAAKSAASAAAYAGTAGVPTILTDNSEFSVSENQPIIEIVCLGSGIITLPASPADSAKYIISSTDKDGLVRVLTAAGSNTHQIDVGDGEIYYDAEISGIYRLELFWLGSKYKGI